LAPLGEIWKQLFPDFLVYKYNIPYIKMWYVKNVLPTSKNNRKYIENQLSGAIEQMEEYIRKYPEFPIPAYYAHPIVLQRMQEIMREERAKTIPEALQVLKNDLKALNSDVVVEKEEYDEIVAIKPMFLVMDYV